MIGDDVDTGVVLPLDTQEHNDFADLPRTVGGYIQIQSSPMKESSKDFFNFLIYFIHLLLLLFMGHLDWALTITRVYLQWRYGVYST